MANLIQVTDITSEPAPLEINATRFLALNKYALIAGIAVYLACIFTPLKNMPFGLLLVFWTGFIHLFHQKYFIGRLKLAGLHWLLAFAATCLTYDMAIVSVGSNYGFILWIITAAICLVPAIVLLVGWTTTRPSRKTRLRIVNTRIVVQTLLFVLWAWVTAWAMVRDDNGYAIMYWAAFHVVTTAILPFLAGRVMCGWICPNATFQDGLLKFMDYKRIIPRLPRAIEEQSNSAAMNISGPVDTRAPFMPATLLLAWVPMFVCETVFDLTQEIWYPVVFMFGLYILSVMMPWRKLCTHFCWLSSYRGIASQTSLWRIRFSPKNCHDCKTCPPEDNCPFYINISKQDNEMPATCCTCFTCVEKCPFPSVLTYTRGKEEKKRLWEEAK
jgi:hypothetical protein